jgi:hypothetical protein
MIPYLHFTGGDYLFFAGLAPTSNGAIAGACIVLVILAILERAVAGARGIFALKVADRYVTTAPFYHVTNSRNLVNAFCRNKARRWPGLK